MIRWHLLLALFIFYLAPGAMALTTTPTSTPCQYKNYGDANCDNQLTSEDFTIWTDEFLRKVTSKQADFSEDTAISLIDLEILIRASLRGLPSISNALSPSIALSPSVTPGTASGTITPTGVLSPSTAPSVTTSIPTTLTPTSIPSGAEYPAQVLNLTNWKVTLPTGANEDPTEIKQPDLAEFKIDPWFMVTSDGTGVKFRAPVNGVTTSGSGYPRSELREMTDNGTENADWSSTSGVHTMILDQAITAVPQTKKHVVAGQIHDAGDDVIVIRLEYPKLFIDINGADGPVLDSGYSLGKRFTIKFEVSNGQTRIYYNNASTPAYTLNKDYSGAYFKAGAYTQSNCESDKEGSSLCNANNFGEVVIYSATVTHQ